MNGFVPKVVHSLPGLGRATLAKKTVLAGVPTLDTNAVLEAATPDYFGAMAWRATEPFGSVIRTLATYVAAMVAASLIRKRLVRLVVTNLWGSEWSNGFARDISVPIESYGCKADDLVARSVRKHSGWGGSIPSSLANKWVNDWEAKGPRYFAAMHQLKVGQFISDFVAVGSSVHSLGGPDDLRVYYSDLLESGEISRFEWLCLIGTLDDALTDGVVLHKARHVPAFKGSHTSPKSRSESSALARDAEVFKVPSETVNFGSSRWRLFAAVQSSEEKTEKDGGATVRLVYTSLVNPEVHMVIKLFGGSGDDPVTLKLWRTTDLLRTMGHWSTKDPIPAQDLAAHVKRASYVAIPLFDRLVRIGG